MEGEFNVTLSDSSWYSVETVNKDPIKELYLVEWSITGVPTTLGVPDQLKYSLQFEGLNYPRITRTDGKMGIPLRLEGTFTTSNNSGKEKLVASSHNSTTVFKIRLVDSSGASATFSNAEFWFRYTSPPKRY
jgi:hypothetical protein